ncbi:MAG TPA: ABC transporter ATP-binding protein [Candidatus Desulfofervidus auxilii]|uniref:ABC transporter ATP-binding protein n=1 Tax=Desulfofervidus auxilii TaxID=1621989 RepID=A0A7C0U2C6_DESA2|nr:ABC transporter ATP-binding protein [Candidatus Desulfofervidus auxilii]
MSKIILEIKELWKSFFFKGERVDVLKGINLNIHSGEAIAIIGASGVGKSTFLHILGALERPTKGTVLYYGKDIFNLSAKELARFRNQKIGFVFQFHYLLPEFTALENLMLPALIAGWSKEKAKKRANELLEEVVLTEKAHHRPGELSGGEQQRVAIARALMLEPEIVLADEPTGNLDEMTAKKVQMLLFSLYQKKRITLIVATHNLRFAALFPICYELTDGQFKRRELK